MNPLSDTEPVIARLYNSMIKALNDQAYLPKYIIFIPDKDIVELLEVFVDGTAGKILEDNIHWLVKNVSRALSRDVTIYNPKD